MSPFSPNFKGQLAAEMTEKKARVKAGASKRASDIRARLRASDDPHKVAVGQGTIPGMGTPHDPAKAGKIRKPSQL